MMRPKFSLCWKALADHPHLYLAFILLAEACAATLICWKGYLEPGLIPNLLGAREILATHHIQSTFLPIGYPALLGWAQVAGSAFGQFGRNAGIFAMQIAVLLLIVLAVRAILLRFGSARFATTAALLIGFYPQFLSGVKKINDANLTLLTLLALLLALLKLRHAVTWPNALFAGATLAAAVLVRPNLILMALLLPWSVHGERRPRALAICAAAASAALLIYAGVTGVVHGSPFFPRNGPYNLYAGLNPYTEVTLRRDLNAENSILPALAANGLHPHLDWRRQSDIPSIDDIRDLTYAPFYMEQSKAFLLQHPGQSLRLSAVKLVTLMRQNYDNKDGESAKFHKLTVAFKKSVLLVIPCWIVLLLSPKVRALHLPSQLVLWMVVLYFLPFLLTNADPRFRITIEGILLLDLARILYALFQNRAAPPRLAS